MSSVTPTLKPSVTLTLTPSVAPTTRPTGSPSQNVGSITSTVSLVLTEAVYTNQAALKAATHAALERCRQLQGNTGQDEVNITAQLLVEVRGTIEFSLEVTAEEKSQVLEALASVACKNSPNCQVVW